MAELSNYYSGDLAATLDRMMEWMLSRQNANLSAFVGNVAFTPTDPAFAEGAIVATSASFAQADQDVFPSVVFDPILTSPIDDQEGPDGFPINYSATPLPSGNLFVNILALTETTNVSGRVVHLPQPAGGYRVDVYSRTDVFYYQGSSAIDADDNWKVANVAPGTAIAFLMPATEPQPQAGEWTAAVTGWVSHSNLGIGNRLHDFFIRLYAKTDIEYLVEDNIPLIVQDSTHARFGVCSVFPPGTGVAHLLYNDPNVGLIELYSTLQNEAVYSDLPRSIEVPRDDPDFAPPSLLTSSNLPYIQNRCWIYDAALAIIAFTVGGLWDSAKRIVTRLNALRDDPGYLPSKILEDAEDGSISRWSQESGGGTVANVFDTSVPPAQSGGSNVMVFTATSAPSAWSYAGPGLPDTNDSIVEWRFKTAGAFKFTVGVTTSSGKVAGIELVSSGAASFDAVAKKITLPVTWVPDEWRVINQNLTSLIGQYVAGETLLSVTSFKIELDAVGELRLDQFTAGAPQPTGSLSFSYDVYNGQVDQAYIRTGAMAWVCYAYAIYIERTGDFSTAALGLESMLRFLFSLQNTEVDLRQNLILGGWGLYQNPGYQYIPGKLTWVSTEHNVDCYFAFQISARVLPTAAQNLYQRNAITKSQYDSLIDAASLAGSMASEIQDAILNQLWIAPSGQTPGHFAQGAGESGLDTSLALDASGSWAALFCHDVGEDAKALECLKFIYENFFLSDRTIQKTSEPDSYNQAYEQLIPFDGFKPYADSTGGYAGSPDSVWMEGTCGALAAYLRMGDDAGLQAYFDTGYPGGFSAFLSRLVQSVKTVASTVSDQGLLSFSLAARSLPWELSVRKTIASTEWFWITATSNDILFTTSSQPLKGRPYLKVPQGVQEVIRQLDGQGSIGALELESTTGSGFMTALVSSGNLEGRKVTLKVGYPGMAACDFVTVATQQVESVQVVADTTGFVIQCRDLKRSAKTNIFTKGDDGEVISSEHPRSVLANPIDTVLMVFQNELGFGQTPYLPETSWKRYDPAEWDAAASPNRTLIDPNPYVDVQTFLDYRNGIFAGYLMEFEFDRAVEAKQFLEYEIFRPLGGYMLVLPDGRLSPRFFFPPFSFLNLFEFNERNMTVLPGIERQPIINQVTCRMDYDGSQFQREFLFVDAPSLEKYDLAGQHIIESKGLRTERGGASLAGLTANRIFRRYGGIDPITGKPNGGACILTIVSHFMTLTVEAGDYVLVSHPLIPNFETGRRGVFNRVFEVIEKQPNYSEGTITYKLLDTGWMRAKRVSRVAPSGTPPFRNASNYARSRYLFVAEESTMAYSDGTPGKTVF